MVICDIELLLIFSDAYFIAVVLNYFTFCQFYSLLLLNINLTRCDALRNCYIVV